MGSRHIRDPEWMYGVQVSTRELRVIVVNVRWQVMQVGHGLIIIGNFLILNIVSFTIIISMLSLLLHDVKKELNFLNGAVLLLQLSCHL